MAVEENKLLGYLVKGEGFLCLFCMLEKMRRGEPSEILAHVRRETFAAGQEWVFCDCCDRMIRI